MNRVLEHLKVRVHKFNESPLFHFMRDRSIEPQRRLSFAPCLSHFVMTFADLYSLVLREEPAGDRFQELVNIHTREDGGHWKWFLADLEKLGCDPSQKFSRALHFLWSDATVRSRLLSYHMCRLGFRADSLRKLVLVQCIEATGKVTLGHAAQVVRELGTPLTYFGPHHFDTESDHTLEDADVHRALEEIELPAETAAELCGLVVESFDLFTAFVDELLAYAMRAPADQSGIART